MRNPARPAYAFPASRLARARSAGRLAAGRGDRDVRQRRIRLRAVPVALARLDVHHVADGDIALLGFTGDGSAARRDDEYLIAVMRVPAGRRSGGEIDDVAAKVLRLTVGDDLLARAAHVSTGPSGDRRRRAHRLVR